MNKRPKPTPRDMKQVLTYGMKFRFQADYEGAPLRKSEWSAWCDQLRHEGKR